MCLHDPEDKTDSGINSDFTYYFQRAVEMDCFLFALPKKEVVVQNKLLAKN